MSHGEARLWSDLKNKIVRGRGRSDILERSCRNGSSGPKREENSGSATTGTPSISSPSRNKVPSKQSPSLSKTALMPTPATSQLLEAKKPENPTSRSSTTDTEFRAT